MFNEKVTHTVGKSVIVHSFKPNVDWTGAQSPSQIATFGSTDTTSEFMGTRYSFGKKWGQNRLHKVLVEAGAFTDDKGNAFAGINGLGSSSSDCFFSDSA